MSSIDESHLPDPVPMRLRLIPTSGRFDSGEFLDTIAASGVDVADISADVLQQLNDRLPELMERLLADEDAASTFDRDPGSFRDLLGDELADALVTLRERVMPESTGRRTRRRATRLVTAADPAVEERADTLRADLVKWAVARRPNMAALEKSPERTIERRYAGESEAVRKALLRDVRKGAASDA